MGTKYLTIFLLTLAVWGEEYPVRFFVNSKKDFVRARKAVRYVEDYIPATGFVKAYVDDEGFVLLEMAGFSPVRLVDTSAVNAAYALAHPKEVLYHSYDELSDWAHSLAGAYPEIVALDSIGPTVDGRWIWVLNITDNPGVEENEPEFVYISTMHGDEPVGTELLIWLCDSLTQKYGDDPRITRVVDSVSLWVVPMMNPDGNVRAQRYNANDVDLNRNFPVPDGTVGNDGTYALQPETRAMMDFLSGRHPSMAANFHTGAVVVNYPWDFDTVRAPDDSLLKVRCRDYASLNPAMDTSSYFPGGITNGYDWYEVNGSMQDWHYHEFNVPHLTIELNDVKWPPDTALPRIWEENYEAMLRQIELSLTGIHGVVIDSLTGEPLAAYVWINQIKRWTATDPALGDFHRELLAGTYSLTVVAEGYCPKVVEGITLPTDTSRVNLVIRLVPADTVYFSDFESDSGGLSAQGFEFYQDWEWGVPDTGNMLPPSVPSGNRLWATSLDGNYSDSSQSRLVLDVDLTGVAGAWLVYDEWYRFQPVNWGSADTVAHDGGRILVVAGSETTQVAPPWGYYLTSSEYNWLIAEGDSIFADDEPGTPWHICAIPLGSFSGEEIALLWDFGSSNRNTAPGWYIDNVSVVFPRTSIGLVQRRDVPKDINLRVYPNPFNDACVIQIPSGVNGVFRVGIYDIRGNIVADFEISGKEKFVWRPPHNVSGGVYLVRVCGQKGAVLMRRVVYVP